jgi:quercetin dioxygenase-like cupin family protein
MTDDATPTAATTATLDDQVTHVADVRAVVPIEAGKIGHHTALSVGGARVIVLSFDAGQQMREHRSHHPLLVHAIDGTVRITADGQSYDLSSGGLLYLPDAMPHSVEALEPSRISLTPIGV